MEEHTINVLGVRHTIRIFIMARAGAGECDCRPLPFRPVLPSFYGTWYSWKHLSENHYFWRYYLRSLKEKFGWPSFLQILPSVVLEFTKYRVIIIHNPQDKKYVLPYLYDVLEHAHMRTLTDPIVQLSCLLIH